MSFEVWHGTPNEMDKIHVAMTQTAATKWARDHLEKMIPQATKYDSSAIDNIRSTREQMLQTSPITTGDMRSWQFPYIAVTYRIEIRNVR